MASTRARTHVGECRWSARAITAWQTEDASRVAPRAEWLADPAPSQTQAAIDVSVSMACQASSQDVPLSRWLRPVADAPPCRKAMSDLDFCPGIRGWQAHPFSGHAC